MGANINRELSVQNSQDLYQRKSAYYEILSNIVYPKPIKRKMLNARPKWKIPTSQPSMHRSQSLRIFITTIEYANNVISPRAPPSSSEHMTYNQQKMPTTKIIASPGPCTLPLIEVAPPTNGIGELAATVVLAVELA